MTVEVVNADAATWLRAAEGESIDLIIADPPYNLGKEYGNDSDNREFDEYLDFSQQWLREAQRVLKPTGTIYVFMGVRFISYIYQILERELGMRFNNWISWHYTQGLGKKKGFSPRHDDILMFTKSAKFVFNLDDVRVPQKYYRERNNMRGANPGDVWQYSHVHYCNENRQAHPTQKPEGLIERMVLASSNRNDVVLDPFAGSGTTLRVCQQIERECTGIELNPTYVSAIKDRLAKPFYGFDSIDPRMERIPLDLRDEKIRNDYLANHERWFLKNHQNALKEYRDRISRLYGNKKADHYKDSQQAIWFDDTYNEAS